MKDVQLTPPIAEALAGILSRFPEVAGLSVTLLGSGTDHHAFDAGGRFVFRVPRSAEAASGGERERRLTSMLAPRLPLAIPLHRFVVGPSERLPFGASGYERLPGEPALRRGAELPRRREVAHVLGVFLRALHDVDVLVAAEAGAPPDDDPTREEWSAQAIEDVARARGDGLIDAAMAAALQGYLRVAPAGAYRPALVHGDLAAEHVLLDAAGSISGVIDWSDAMIGDPALDLAGLFHWGGAEMLSEALETYGGCGAETVARARWFAACRAVADIVFGVDEGKPDYVAAGQHALLHAGPER